MEEIVELRYTMGGHLITSINLSIISKNLRIIIKRMKMRKRNLEAKRRVGGKRKETKK